MESPKVQQHLGDPPALHRAIIVCAQERQVTPHEFVGKERAYAGQFHVYLRIRYRCINCGSLRYWGNEMLRREPKGA